MATTSGYTIRVEGYRECVRALRMIDRDAQKKVRDGLKKAAEPVVKDSRRRISKYQGASLGTIGPRVVTNGVYVTQRAKKVTGLRPDFGALQMTKGLMPALEHNAPLIEHDVDAAIGILIQESGFH